MLENWLFGPLLIKESQIIGVSVASRLWKFFMGVNSCYVYDLKMFSHVTKITYADSLVEEKPGCSWNVMPPLIIVLLLESYPGNYCQTHVMVLSLYFTLSCGLPYGGLELAV